MTTTKSIPKQTARWSMRDETRHEKTAIYKQQVATLTLQGLTTMEIAHHLGLTYSAIRRFRLLLFKEGVISSSCDMPSKNRGKAGSLSLDMERRAVKTGQLNYVDDKIDERLNDLITEVEALAAASSYPERVDAAWLDGIVLQAYQEQLGGPAAFSA